MNRLLLVILLAAFLTAMAAEEVSVKRAVLYSAILPGMGEYYSGATNKAIVFWVVEAASWISMLRLQQERDWTVESYQKLADTYAGLQVCDDDHLYQLAQDYMSSDNYNDEVIRDARNYYLIYRNDPDGYRDYIDERELTGSETWQWQSESKWREYRGMRSDKQDMEIYANFALSALFINRVVSMVDAAISARSFNRDHKYGSLRVIPDFQREGMNLVYEYRF